MERECLKQLNVRLINLFDILFCFLYLLWRLLQWEIYIEKIVYVRTREYSYKISHIFNGTMKSRDWVVFFVISIHIIFFSEVLLMFISF